MPPAFLVELHPPSPAWQAAALAEAERFAALLGPVAIRVHHIGSTSIPGIYAKPILDLLPEVTSLAELDGLTARLTEHGLQAWGEYGIQERRYFTCDDPATGRRISQFHCFEQGRYQIARHLAFRDYLRAHPEIAQAYSDEKRRCVVEHRDSHSYTDAKAPWIARHLPLALEYYRQL